MQELLVFGYSQQFQSHGTLTSIPIEIINIIYLFYNKKRMLNEWISGELINYNKQRQIRQGIHFKTGKISLLIEINTPKIRHSKKRQMLREFSMMKKINHPNIIPIVDITLNADKYDHNGKKTKCILYQFDHKHYCLLFDIICFIGHLNEYSSLSYFKQIVNALSAIYEFGIAPHKIAEKHLFLDSNFTLKLMIDTDIPAMQPKKCHRRHWGQTCSKSANIFDCGILLFSMYAGFPPFRNAIASDWWWDKLSKGWKYLVASEKQKYQKDRDKHVAASTRKIQLFWKAHERTRIFNDKLKNIIVNMLHPYYEYRYKINDIKQHEWYSQPLESNNMNKLQQYMKDTLVCFKQEYGFRAQLQNKQNQYDNVSLRALERMAKQLDPYNGFMTNMSVLTDDFLINYGMYQFFTQIEPAQIAARLQVLFAHRDGSKLTVSCHDADILIECVNIDNNVILLCKQYLIKNAYFLVKFSRVKGSSARFHLIMQDIYQSHEIMSAMDFNKPT